MTRYVAVNIWGSVAALWLSATLLVPVSLNLYWAVAALPPVSKPARGSPFSKVPPLGVTSALRGDGAGEAAFAAVSRTKFRPNCPVPTALVVAEVIAGTVFEPEVSVEPLTVMA